mmetsp:Transcript_80961/g.242530  ORF Transcript_80961/g.242530 Transcript_80961/m.242530 type:complete len:145 (-) Transcript_80961:51-485(-)
MHRHLLNDDLVDFVGFLHPVCVCRLWGRVSCCIQSLFQAGPGCIWRCSSCFEPWRGNRFGLCLSGHVLQLLRGSRLTTPMGGRVAHTCALSAPPSVCVLMMMCALQSGAAPARQRGKCTDTSTIIRDLRAVAVQSTAVQLARCN